MIKWQDNTWQIPMVLLLASNNGDHHSVVSIHNTTWKSWKVMEAEWNHFIYIIRCTTKISKTLATYIHHWLLFEFHLQWHWKTVEREPCVSRDSKLTLNSRAQDMHVHMDSLRHLNENKNITIVYLMGSEQ